MIYVVNLCVLAAFRIRRQEHCEQYHSGERIEHICRRVTPRQVCRNAIHCTKEKAAQRVEELTGLQCLRIVFRRREIARDHGNPDRDFGNAEGKSHHSRDNDRVWQPRGQTEEQQHGAENTGAVPQHSPAAVSVREAPDQDLSGDQEQPQQGNGQGHSPHFISACPKEHGETGSRLETKKPHNDHTAQKPVMVPDAEP